MNKLKSTFALSALLLTGLALSACTDQGAEVDEDERPAVVETTELVPSPYPSVSVSVSPSTSVKPSTSVSPSKVTVDPDDCDPNDDGCPDLPNDGR